MFLEKPRCSLNSIVSNLSKHLVTGTVEKKLNDYFRTCLIEDVIGGFTNFMKLGLNYKINLRLLDPMLRIEIITNMSLMLTLISLNSEYFSLADITLRENKSFVLFLLQNAPEPNIIYHIIKSDDKNKLKKDPQVDALFLSLSNQDHLSRTPTLQASSIPAANHIKAEDLYDARFRTMPQAEITESNKPEAIIIGGKNSRIKKSKSKSKSKKSKNKKSKSKKSKSNKSKSKKSRR
jgi:hypothetical protein